MEIRNWILGISFSKEKGYMDPLVVLLMIVTSVLAILLVIVGIQVIMILKEVKETLHRLNSTLSAVDTVVGMLSRPVSGLADLVAGVRTGISLAESFTGWLNRNKRSEEYETSE